MKFFINLLIIKIFYSFGVVVLDAIVLYRHDGGGAPILLGGVVPTIALIPGRYAKW